MNDSAALYAQVVISISHSNIDKIYHYKIPPGVGIIPGIRVHVPFGQGNKQTLGYVVGLASKTDIAPERIKTITKAIDRQPVITGEMLALCWWMKEKYYTTLSQCIKTVLPAGIKSKKTLSKKVKFAWLLRPEEAEATILACLDNPKRYAQGLVLEMLLENGMLPVSELTDAIGISESPVKTLEKYGLVQTQMLEIKQELHSAGLPEEEKSIRLNREQSEGLKRLLRLMDSETPEEALLHGVTGSGKTEIYLRLIERCIEQGKQAIVLVPEIALTPQTVGRFIGRFGDKVTVTHSKMNLRERYEQWEKALHGEVSIMVGPRSAVFAPFKNLGIIVIDEEHEHSYQSEVTPKYDARAVAGKRIQHHHGLLLLGSATPSVSTYYKAKSGRLDLIRLTQRANGEKLPSVQVVDMRAELLEGNRSIFSAALREELQKNIDQGEQTILFLNRRGYASFVSCRQCGHAVKCENCNVTYTYHMDGDKLVCHYCGKIIANLKNCPDCGSVFIKQFGIGTQKVEEEVHREFPGVRTIRMDLDTTSKKTGHEDILKRFWTREADVLIGTQMIAKGHDFPGVTLVGIIAADISLNAGDFRSAETTFQLITQVAGRAGRADLPGRVIVQTYHSEHYAIVHAQRQDYEQFFKEEILIRKDMLYPPYTHLFMILLTGIDEKKVIECAHKLVRLMAYYNQKKELFEILGPAPAQISKIKKQFRWKILVKCTDENKLRNFAVYCTDKLKQIENTEGIFFNLTLDPAVII